MAESSIPATQNLDSEKKKYEISLYKRLLEPTNPYVVYNNTDRMLNIVYRYYTTGGFESLYQKEKLVGIKDKLGYQYEAQSNLLAQYYWATTAILGVGYSINRPQLVSGNQGEAAIAALVLTRSVVNMVLETSLAIANNVRWAEKRFGTVEYHPALHGSSSSANAFDEQLPNALQFPMGELDENWRFVPFSHTASSREIAHPVGSEPSERTIQQSSAALVSDSTGSRDKIKNIRNYHGTVTSAGFALNAALAVGIQLGLIIRAAQKPDAERNGAEIASAVIGLAGATANVFANSFKSLDSFSKTLVSNPGLLLDPDLPEKIARWEKASKNGIFGKLGSYLGGSLNGLAGIASLSPYLFSDRLTSQQKGLVAAEISAQVVGSAGQISANVWLAQTTGRGGAYAKVFDDTGAATRSVRYLRLAGPGMLTASAALLAVTSPLEIYALAKQGEYARDLDELGKKLGAHGYSGDSLLANFYREKNTAQSGIFAATATVELFASVLMVSAIAAGPGAPVAAVAGLALSGFAALARAVESPILERLAEGYASKIQDAGGAAAFFDSNLSAQYKAQLTSLGPDYLDELQAGFKVDSVVGVSTMILTRQAMELAVLTRNTDRLRSAHVYIDRFIGGKVQDSGIQKTTIDAETGKLALGGAAGTTQALTFLNPLLQPGVEKRETVEVRGKASTTSLEITLDGKKVTPDNVKGWTIDDGGASSTMDLRKVVTRVVNRDKTEAPLELPITVNGAGGDDTVIANASQLTFNGGDGFDVVDYGGLKGQVSFQVEKTGNGFKVTKTMGSVESYHEVVKQQSYAPTGKRTETVQSREFELSTISNVTETDTLTDVEEVRGTGGNDKISAKAGGTGKLRSMALSSVSSSLHSRGYVLDGNGGDDTVEGGDGGDTLLGGAGRDTVSGGEGNDLILQDFESVGDTLGGGDGIDTVDYSLTRLSGGVGASGIVADLGKGTVDKTLSGTHLGLNATARYIRNERNDSISGGGGDDYLAGGEGRDRLDGGTGDDQLAGGAGQDSVTGGDGDDLVTQDMEAVDEMLDGGAGTDTVDYSVTNLVGMASRGIVADLDADGKGKGNGQIFKAFEGSAIGVGAQGRYIRIYHSDATAVLALTELKVFSKGVNVASGRASWFGGDSPANDVWTGGSPLSGGAFDTSALTNGLAGGQQAASYVTSLKAGVRAYIDLDLGDFYDIDSIALWGASGYAGSNNNLRVYVANTKPALGSPTAYDDLARDPDVLRIDFDTVATTAVTTATDTLTGIENLVGTALADTLTGDANANALSGNDGDDLLAGKAGGDRLHAGAGNDTLEGGSGDDELAGGDGKDMVRGGDGNDVILQDLEAYAAGSSGAWDTIDGGAGADTVDYSFTVFPYATRSGVNDVATDVGIDVDLLAGKATKFTGAGFSVYDTLSGIESVVGTRFNDNLGGDANDNALDGGDGRDVLKGGIGDDLLMGGGGDDMLEGGAGNDDLAGEAGIDSVSGGDGDDTIVQDIEAVADTLDGGAGRDTVDYSGTSLAGKATTGIVARLDADNKDQGNGTVVKTLDGNDVLNGGNDSDSYRFTRGDGVDLIQENGNGGLDLLEFYGDVRYDKLWWSRDANDLQISIIGTSDKVTVSNWFGGGVYGVNNHQVERFTTGDGKQLGNAQVDRLVQGMAGFSPPGLGSGLSVTDILVGKPEWWGL